MKFPVFSLKNREFGFFRDGFAPDCLLQRRVGSELGSDAPGIMESGAAVGIDTHRTNSSLGSVAGALWWGDPAPPQRRGYSRGAAPSSDFLDQLHLRAVGPGNPAHMATVADALFEDLRAVFPKVREGAGIIVACEPEFSRRARCRW